MLCAIGNVEMTQRSMRFPDFSRSRTPSDIPCGIGKDEPQTVDADADERERKNSVLVFGRSSVSVKETILNLDALSQFDSAIERELEKFRWPLSVLAHRHKKVFTPACHARLARADDRFAP